MYGTAHRAFAVGTCTMLAYVFGLHLLSLLWVILLGGIIGTIPDIDITLIRKYGYDLKHRTITHNPIFIAFVAFIFTLIIFLVNGFIQIYTDLDWYTGLHLQEGLSYPLPTWNGFQQSEVIAIFITLFVGGITHVMLDVPTYMGFTVGDHQYHGIMRSSGAGNIFFTINGILLTITGLLGSVCIRYLEVEWIDQRIIYWILGIGALFSIGAIAISIKARSRRDTNDLYCGELDNGVNVCSTSQCIQWNGEEFCFYRNLFD